MIDVDLARASAARDAARRFRRGQHPAALNFRDCLSYALASGLCEALLLVGDDFAQTEIAAVAW